MLRDLTTRRLALVTASFALGAGAAFGAGACGEDRNGGVEIEGATTGGATTGGATTGAATTGAETGETGTEPGTTP